jgi:hypothetical protein
MKKKAFILGGVVAIAIILIVLSLSRPTENGAAQSHTPRSASMDVALGADPQIRDTIHRACYDCHSDRPRYPWYANVWPSSKLVQRDRRTALARLDFSQWDRLSPEMSKIRLMDACAMMSGDKMPLWYYRPFHPQAHLSQQEVQHFCAWAQAQ